MQPHSVAVNGFLTFIKEWIPSIGVIVAGIWILFQWLFGESLRRKKEGPSLDGKLSATIIHSGDGKLVVTVEALWNNHSPLPIYFKISECLISVYRIGPHIDRENSPLVLVRDLGTPVCTNFFLVGACKKSYSFEPNTASTIINHFILEPGIYGIRMELHTDKAEVNWWKEMILDAQKHGSTVHAAP
jgi:hypothetical protein